MKSVEASGQAKIGELNVAVIIKEQIVWLDVTGVIQRERETVRINATIPQNNHKHR
jgi:hypothetical protein